MKTSREARTRMRRWWIAPVLLATTIGMTACDDEDGPTVPERQTIARIASTTPQLSTLTTAVQAANLVATLEGTGPFTVFAPANAAFEALPSGTVDALLASGNGAILGDLLSYHVVAGALSAAELSDGQVLSTVEGGTLTVSIQGGTVKINGATVTTADVQASNGVVHVIDGVLTEGLDAVQRAAITADLSTLVQAVGASGLAGALTAEGPFTIFAPVNSAFAAIDEEMIERLLDAGNVQLLQKVLGYHVVAGKVMSTDLTDGAEVATLQGESLTIDLDGGARVNGANIVAADIEVSNGVVHLIDGVLLDHLDIVDLAILNGFDALVEAVAAAGLVDALRGDNEGAGFTVFAPTDAAFEALGEVPSDPEVLAQVLLYHVVPATALSTDLSDDQALPTLQGGTLTVDLSAGVRIEGANSAATVVAADVGASNGVIHVIDTVLLP